MAVKRQKIVADFETTTDPNDVRVWAACAVDIDTNETVHLSNNIASFIDWLSNKNTVCYFHNMKFDISFVLDYLIRERGFRYSTEHEPNTFETLITDGGVFYSVTVYFSKKNKKYQKVVFYDSLKKLPFPVSVIAKAFELPDSKLSIDYDAPRPIGHELTEEEKEYIVADCRIVAAALKIQFEQGLKKMTNASDAMSGFKKIFGKDYFEKVFPIFPIELDAQIRRAYKGGFVYLNPKYEATRGISGRSYDINSLYPYIMYTRLLPYGFPMFFEGEPEDNERYPLFIVRLRCSFKIKPDHIPTIQLKNNWRFMATEYLNSSEGEIVELVLTNVDLALFLEHYDTLNMEYLDGWRFKGMTGIFKEYIDYWMHIKETTTGALRQLAKLMLNSLYGKFATNPRGLKKVPYLDRDADIVKYRLDDPDERDPVYTAMGAFITAYAREKTIRAAQSVYDRFIYADTDSLKLVGDEVPDIEIHPTHLGAWKDEGQFTDSKFLRAKTYMMTVYEIKRDTLENYAKHLPSAAWIRREADGIHVGVIKVTCAGMPDNVKKSVTYDNFRSGGRFFGKLMPHTYRGGIVLEKSTFTIK